MTFQGQKNIYVCKACGHAFVSLDIDDGVTPFASPCLNCKELAQSLMYRCPQPMLENVSPAIEWYRPNAKNLRSATLAATKIQRSLLRL